MIGKLDQRVTFQSASSIDDGAGGRVRTFANIPSVPTVWAEVVPVRWAEKDEAGAQTTTTVYRVKIRNRTDLDAAMRMLWDTNGGILMNIRELPDPGPRALYRDIFVEQGVAI